jgi:hypothetical protein
VQDTSWSARWDSLRVIWYRRIVNFDSRQQVQMVEAVRTFTSDSGQALRARLDEWTKRLKAWLAEPWDFRRAGRVLAKVALALAFMLLVARGSRWAWWHWQARRRPGAFDPVRREAGRWLARGAERGVLGAEAFAAVRAELLRLRYGHRATWPEPAGVFRRARHALRAARG